MGTVNILPQSSSAYYILAGLAGLARLAGLGDADILEIDLLRTALLFNGFHNYCTTVQTF